MGMGAFAAVEDWDARILEDLGGAPAGVLDAADPSVVRAAAGVMSRLHPAARRHEPDGADGQIEWSRAWPAAKKGASQDFLTQRLLC